MSDKRDPIEQLKELWRGLDAPRPDDSDAPNDERTDAAVAWLRRAWSELEPPPVALPFWLRRRRVVAIVLALASAAAVLVATLAALSHRRAVPSREPSERLALESGATRAPSAVETPLSAPPLVGVPGEIDEQGHVVLRHGSVRLVWLAPSTEPQGADAAPNLQNQ